MKRLILLFSLILFLTAQIKGFWFFGDSPKKGKLVLLHTNDSHGRIKGCGCRHAGGGLVKRSYKIKQIKAEDSLVFVFDGGNVLFGDRDSDRSSGGFAVNAMNLMKYDVVNITPYSFRFGIDSLKSLEMRAEFKMLSANIADAKTDKLLFEPYVIVQKGEFKVGVIGITDPDAYERIPVSCKELVKALDYKPILTSTISKIKNDVDLIVLLSYSGWEKDKQLAEDFPDIDVIIGAYDSKKEYLMMNETIIGQAYRDGKYLGRIDVEFPGVKDQALKMKGEIISMENKDMDDEEMKELLKSFDIHNY